MGGEGTNQLDHPVLANGGAKIVKVGLLVFSLPYESTFNLIFNRLDNFFGFFLCVWVFWSISI